MSQFDVGEMRRVALSVDDEGFIVIEGEGDERFVRALATKVWIEGTTVSWLLDRTPWPGRDEAPATPEGSGR